MSHKTGLIPISVATGHLQIDIYIPRSRYVDHQINLIADLIPHRVDVLQAVLAAADLDRVVTLRDERAGLGTR